MSRERQTLGVSAEESAAAYLIQQGYRITHRRYRNALGEIDLIAERDGKLVFVEVKAKSGTAQGSPEEMVDRRKQQKLKRIIGWFLMELGETKDGRVDVIAVDYTQGEARIRHIEHAFDIDD